MKKLLLLFIITSLCFLGCNKSDRDFEKNDPPLVIVPPKPFKIELSSNLSEYPVTEVSMKSDNKQEMTLLAKVTDRNGIILNKDCKFTLNGNDFNGSSFKTITPGKYIFQASIEDLKSNEYKVTVRDLAERYASVVSSKIYSVNSADLVTIAITFTNISNKKLKYINFDVSCYNKVNDVIKEQLKGSYSIVCQATGFFDPQQSATNYWQLGYFAGASSIKVTLRSVTFEDGTIVYAS